MPKSFLMSEDLYGYVERTWVHESELLAQLREETAKMPDREMQIGPDQGQFLHVLLKLIGAKKALEIGVFTGYSSIVTASALPEDGHLIACDISDEFTSTARRYWDLAGLTNKIELRLGPALETLAKIEAEGHEFDFCFIDADKPNYWNYFEIALRLVRKNGLIAVDNVLWSGEVANDERQDPATLVMRAFNAKVYRDPRVEICLAPIGDGILMARVL